jgi:signal transduction histidine kinase
MPLRRTIPKKSAGKRGRGRTKAQLKRLLKDAQNEVEKLLKAARAENLTRAHLRTRLRRIEKDLRQIEPFEGGGT